MPKPASSFTKSKTLNSPTGAGEQLYRLPAQTRTWLPAQTRTKIEITRRTAEKPPAANTQANRMKNTVTAEFANPSVSLDLLSLALSSIGNLYQFIFPSFLASFNGMAQTRYRR